MPNSKKLLQAAAGSAGGAGAPGPDVDELFSTYLYTGGVSAPLTINNGIDLSGEGGLVWIKNRTSGVWHQLADTERGANKMLSSNVNNAEISRTEHVKSFTSTGFTVGNDNDVNYDVIGGSQDDEHVSWTWRKAPKFFDVVTWTGDGTNDRSISHNLEVSPTILIIKRTDSTSDWAVKSPASLTTGESFTGLYLNKRDARGGTTANGQGIKAISSTDFTVISSGSNPLEFNPNVNNATYVAYLFANNNGDGGFGPDGDQDIIKCGSYTGNASGTGPEINLGFEPQWLLVKNANNSSADWLLLDVMRGWGMGDADIFLEPNSSGADQGSQNWVDITPTGFKITNANGQINGSGQTHIYMAIRRGPLAAPESASDVFAISTGAGTSTPMFTSNFPVDMAINRVVNSSNDNNIVSRLTGKQRLKTNATEAETLSNPSEFDFMDGWYDGTLDLPTFYSWMWKRAPSYFDVVAYTGTGSGSKTINHNLGVVPEMMWVKSRGEVKNWRVYHKDLDATAPEDKYLKLNTTDAVADSTGTWNDTAPTATQFTVGNSGDTNNAQPYIAYLFATVAGVSKVGSYTGNATSDRVIDCGFSNGARFVLIKDVDTSGTNWQVFDTTRGLTSTKAELLRLNLTNAQIPNGSPTQDYHNLIEPDSSGFKLNHTAALQVNASGVNYIFYAIA